MLQKINNQCYVQVKLFSGYRQLLWYTVPHDLVDKIHSGSVVQVPLRTIRAIGIVVAVRHGSAPPTTFELRSIEGVDELASHAQYIEYTQAIAYRYQVSRMTVLYRVLHFLGADHIVLPQDSSSDHLTSDVVCERVLTHEQTIIVDTILPYVQKKIYYAALIHGVTGSGKTEVYKALLKEAYRQGRSALLLVPDVTLAYAFIKRLRAELGTLYPVHGFHSGSTASEKKAVWNALASGVPLIVVGIHLPLLLPFKNMGLIIVDEEHDQNYQEKKHPKFHTKQLAQLAAKTFGVPLVLGSATPSLDTLYLVKQRQYAFFQLKERFGGVFPDLSVVFLLKKDKRKCFWISQQLQDAIAACLQRQEQVLIYLNRRGYNFSQQCADCSAVVRCNSCSVSMTVHEHGQLICHYCGYQKPVLKRCFACNSSRLLAKGVGTQKMVEMLKMLFPEARIMRLDGDVAKSKKRLESTLDAIYKGACDIVVGTQSIAKGHHFERVTLVGVIWADSALHFPVYNATEIMMQQLIQVAGRAGRGGKQSMVIVQTLTENVLFDYLNQERYLQYYAYEIEKRERYLYPPAYALIEIELSHSESAVVSNDAQRVAEFFRHAADALSGAHNQSVIVLGPSVPPVEMVNHITFRKIFLKGPSVDVLIELCALLPTSDYSATIAVTPAAL